MYTEILLFSADLIPGEATVFILPTLGTHYTMVHRKTATISHSQLALTRVDAFRNLLYFRYTYKHYPSVQIIQLLSFLFKLNTGHEQFANTVWLVLDLNLWWFKLFLSLYMLHFSLNMCCLYSEKRQFESSVDLLAHVNSKK